MEGVFVEEESGSWHAGLSGTLITTLPKIPLHLEKGGGGGGRKGFGKNGGK